MGREDTAVPSVMDDDMREQFAGMNVTFVDEGTDEDDGDDGAVVIWDVNWPAFEAFQALRTQWRRIGRGMSGALWTLGLDYAGVAAYLASIAAPAGLFADIMTMEKAALDAFNEIESEAA